MDRIKDYLVRALEMTKSCVVVMKYTKDEPVTRTKLEYISENVQQLGMNLASLKGGFRLPKDYIHPEDRNGFIDAVSIASETKSSFTYRVRLAGDDGVIRDVDVRSEYIDYDADYYMIEYIFQEIAAPVENAQTGTVRGKEAGGRLITKDVLADDTLGEFFGFFARAYGLYSTVVDQDGHSLFPPVGPEAYLGYYYDMFERPENLELFNALKHSVLIQEESVYMELNDGNPDSRVSAVPIMVSGVHLATWMLCAHDKSQTATLRIASREQYRLGELISEYIQRSIMAGRRSSREKELEKQLEFERTQLQVLSELNDQIRKDANGGLTTILREAARVLDVEYVFLTRKTGGADSADKMEGYYSVTGDAPHEINFDAFNESERQQFYSDGFVIDQKNMTNRIRVSAFQGFVRAAMIMPVRITDEGMGRVIFLETRRERIWSESEIHFAKLVGKMIGENLTYIEGVGTRKTSGREILEIFNQLTIKVFIKEAESGRVLFSNDTLNRQLGTDFVGQDSRRMIPEGKEDYESYSSTVLEAPQKQGKRTWRRYINELGGIYDVTEIPMEWIDGRPATAVLLRIAQD